MHPCPAACVRYHHHTQLALATLRHPHSLTPALPCFRSVHLSTLSSENMASCAATLTGMAASSLSLTRSKPVRASAAPQASFSGLRRGSKLDSIAVSRRTSFASQTAIAKSSGRVTCEANTSLIITLSTGALLALGRFVFLPFQRDNVSRQGLPEQNGVTHYEAGDSRAQEVVGMLKTNDPAGFTLVDVLAWGALGHAIGFFILATANNGYTPQF